MEKKRNLCAMIPESLHAEVQREKEQLGQTVSEYIEQILTEHFLKKEGGSMGKTRTLVAAIPEELFLELKDYLAKHKIAQQDFVSNLIRQALDAAKAEETEVAAPEK